ncbi:uncharacterized protein LOC118437140 [Folsomia candida]|uniref:Diazepam-binding inhibitor-like 5 n=1 Tax=Folsomia candida TaxID=158441 RepID=A0A226DR36_FOLCA|nr:uncharacterized protein LOC118437140 [Folsomia candida]OXA47982.1 Diazepam-binding inhibitor-like 5 [Folsomia candida]
MLYPLLVTFYTIIFTLLRRIFSLLPNQKLPIFQNRKKSHHSSTLAEPQKSSPELVSRFTNTAQVFVPLLLPGLISSSDRLHLYSLYKQATSGNCPISLGNFRGPKLSWLSLRGMPTTRAMEKYANFYETLRLKEVEHLTQQNYAGALTREFKTLHNFEPVLHPGHILIPLNQLPPRTLNEYNSAVKTKYMAAGRGKVAYEEGAMHDPRQISDPHFLAIWTETHFSKLVTHLAPGRVELAPYRDLFGVEGNAEDYFIVDLTGVQAIPLRKSDNAVLSPCVVLLKLSPPSQQLVAIAIENLFETRSNSKDLNMPPFPAVLGNLRLVAPTDGVAWEHCKLHGALNANYISGMGLHTVLHAALAGPISLTFESMAGNKRSRPNSVIRRIFEVHSYVHCGVDSNAFDFKESVLFAEGSPYYPWPVDTANGGIYNVARLICDGWGQPETKHPIYDGYNNSRKENIITYTEHEDVLPFRKFVNSFAPPIKEFVMKVVSLVGRDETEMSYMAEFLTALRDKLPSESWVRTELKDCFDLNDNFFEGETLIAKLLNFFIFNAVLHSVEHCLLESKLMKDFHGIIRIGVDFENTKTRREDISECMRKINSVADRSKMYLMNNMVSYPHLSRNFADFFAKEGGYFGSEVFSSSNFPLDRLKVLKSYEEEFASGLERIFEGKINSGVCANITLSDLGVSVQS